MDRQVTYNPSSVYLVSFVVIQHSDRRNEEKEGLLHCTHRWYICVSLTGRFMSICCKHKSADDTNR
jgi:hypothetical protein